LSGVLAKRRMTPSFEMQDIEGGFCIFLLGKKDTYPESCENYSKI